MPSNSTAMGDEQHQKQKEHQQHPRLEQLFRRCDANGTGYIERGDFRSLCQSFGIGAEDSDAIFDDLDHDGDARISFEDFSFGFKDFLTPGARRGSIQLGMEAARSLERDDDDDGEDEPEAEEDEQDQDESHRRRKHSRKQTPPHLPSPLEVVREENFDPETRRRQRAMAKRHEEAKEAWRNFADHLGKEDVRRFLGASGDKIFTLYEELQTSEAPPHLVNQYEEVLSALFADVRRMEQESKKMEEKMAKERENHTAHLKSIEAELDAQVAKVETAAREKARKDHEEEKRQLQDKMEEEMRQLQAQLRIFQKIDTYLNKEKDESTSQEALKKLDSAINENRTLKNSLSNTQTNIALLRAELNQMRTQYDAKCYELTEERENKMEFVYEFDNLNRQLELLRDANQKLQDTNDGLRNIVDVGVLASPRSAASDYNGGASLLSPDVLRSSSDVELAERLFHRQQPSAAKRHHRRKRTNTSGASPAASDYGGGAMGGGGEDSADSVRSRGSDHVRPRITEQHFGIKRLMDDLEDSGHSTLPNEDLRSTPEDEMEDAASAEGIDTEASEAIHRLERVVREEEQRQEGGGGGGDLSPGETRKALPPPVKPRTRLSVDEGTMEEEEEGDSLTELPGRAAMVVGSVAAGAALEEESFSSEGPPSRLQRKPTPVPIKRPPKDFSHRPPLIHEQQQQMQQPWYQNRSQPPPLMPVAASGHLRDLEPTGPPDRTYKVVFAGDAAVGKTTFINRLTKGIFMSNLSSTLGVDFQVKTIRVDHRNIAIQLWDTAGQERFRSVTRSYFRRADGVMLLYDVTSDRSFLSVRQWVEAVDDVAEKRIPIMMCANKTDLREEATALGRRCVSTDEGDKLAREHSAIFIETSAKDGSNVIDAIVQLSRDMCSSEDVEVKTSALKVRDEPKKKNCCSK